MARSKVWSNLAGGLYRENTHQPLCTLVILAEDGGGAAGRTATLGSSVSIFAAWPEFYIHDNSA